MATLLPGRLHNHAHMIDRAAEAGVDRRLACPQPLDLPALQADDRRARLLDGDVQHVRVQGDCPHAGIGRLRVEHCDRLGAVEDDHHRAAVGGKGGRRYRRRTDIDREPLYGDPAIGEGRGDGEGHRPGDLADHADHAGLIRLAVANA